MPRNPQRQLTRYKPYAKNMALSATTAKAVFNAGKAVGNTIAKQINKRTKPAEKEHKKFAKVIEGHGDITFSKFSAKGKPGNALTKKLASARGKLHRRHINSYHLTGVAGRQFAFSVQYFEAHHLKQMVQDVYSTLASQELGGVNPTTGNLEPFLSKSHQCLTLTSFTNSSQTLTIYDLLCKRDTDEHPTLAWKNGLIQQDDTTADMTNIPVGVTPYQSKNFREKWKVEKVTQLQLRPGETHKHYIDVNPNRAISNARVNPTNSEVAKTYLSGITRAVMIVAEGSLGRGAASGSVTTTAASVGAMWQRNYNFTANTRAVVRHYPVATSGDLATALSDVKLYQPDGDLVTATVVT